ncbi:MAG: NAD(P)-dependent oxidoreductase [Spirochaeta sp.]|nr:NAD(P)-dependent oxidoreductase [Spirochaeta sp.]
MKILALDGYGVNPGDVSWSPITNLGDFTAIPCYTWAAAKAHAATARVVLTDDVVFDAAQFDRFLALKFLGLFATGHDQVDLDAARTRGVAVANVPGYSRASVSQLAISLILSLAHQVPAYNRMVRSGGWRRGSRFAYLPEPLVELAGKSIAVIGLGSIGTDVARVAAALGMRVLGWDQRRKDTPGIAVAWRPWRDLLRESDVVTLHLPLNAETRHIIDAEALALMKQESFLINTSRGGLIDDAAVAAALHRGDLGGAGLDVLGEVEPPEADNPLLTAPRCIITPHIGWATREARQRCINEVAANVDAYIRGIPRNRIA